ncbi:hypothetical protein MNBD_CHLOROFLEXI01-4473 [hydrothermal vent metagenome]|uniref:Uncharacterized protein n=1 Tax=hydrothermal vent metagenome TaxID=652676 RepID=A0A3B0UKD5_9ZZZZ
MLRNVLKRIPWLLIIYSLLVLAAINLVLAKHFLTPPAESTLTTFWPIVFYSKLFIPLILFLPVGFLFTIGIYLIRKKWMEAFASFLVLFVVILFLFGLLFSSNLWFIDTIQMEEETIYLGAVGNNDGGRYLTFCSEKEGKGICDDFFIEYWYEGTSETLELNIEPNTKTVIVTMKGITIYKYDGHFPGRCDVASEILWAADISGDCGSYYHGGNSDR